LNVQRCDTCGKENTGVKYAMPYELGYAGPLSGYVAHFCSNDCLFKFVHKENMMLERSRRVVHA